MREESETEKKRKKEKKRATARTRGLQAVARRPEGHCLFISSFNFILGLLPKTPKLLCTCDSVVIGQFSMIDRSLLITQHCPNLLHLSLTYNPHNSLWVVEGVAVSVFIYLLPVERGCRPYLYCTLWLFRMLQIHSGAERNLSKDNEKKSSFCIWRSIEPLFNGREFRESTRSLWDQIRMLDRLLVSVYGDCAYLYSKTS